ncbi:hypothetical protein KSP40_PGU002056 [Platanthera guangdongensis]|uniref:Uncharacterized protein n=1 Tax=Platanthera guangdongensis TaxID=2320717 RepID=A0ABR2MVP3_9ASPA
MANRSAWITKAPAPGGRTTPAPSHINENDQIATAVKLEGMFAKHASQINELQAIMLVICREVKPSSAPPFGQVGCEAWSTERVGSGKFGSNVVLIYKELLSKHSGGTGQPGEIHLILARSRPCLENVVCTFGSLSASSAGAGIVCVLRNHSGDPDDTGTLCTITGLTVHDHWSCATDRALAHSTSTPYPSFTRLHSAQEHFHPLAFCPLAQPKFGIAADTLTSPCEAVQKILRRGNFAALGYLVARPSCLENVVCTFGGLSASSNGAGIVCVLRNRSGDPDNTGTLRTITRLTAHDHWSCANDRPALRFRSTLIISAIGECARSVILLLQLLHPPPPSSGIRSRRFRSFQNPPAKLPAIDDLNSKLSTGVGDEDNLENGLKGLRGDNSLVPEASSD